MASNDSKKEYDKILKQYFGYDFLKDLQYEIIKNIINNNDVVALLPTSYGKSICYQLPYLITKKNVIVVSPLISLMEDQMRELNEKNIDAICLNSSNKNKAKDISEIYKGNPKIIYTTPEYLTNNTDFLEKIVFTDKLALIAIDECHCVSHWGHSFRSDYNNLGILKEIAEDIPILALTATATDKVIKDVAKNLCLDDPKIIKHSVDRPNLYIEIQRRYESTLKDTIVPLLKDNKDGKILIYCKTTKDTDNVAEKLKKYGFECEAYHAKMENEDRTNIQTKYTSGDLNIIVSTIAFGMGINIPNIRLMIHYNCSNDVESYLQEIGRAGRDGKPSKCYMFYSDKDFLLSDLFLKDITDKKIKMHKEADINYLKKYVTTNGCRRHCILKYFDEDIDDCLNCDNCLSKRYTRDFTKEVYLLLSLINSLTNNFGVNTYIKLLLGSKEKTIEKYIPFIKNLYGKGNNYNEEWWKKLFGLLINNGLLTEERIKSDKFAAIVIKQTSKGSNWFHQYKHNESEKRPKFEISLPLSFQKIDINFDNDNCDNNDVKTIKIKEINNKEMEEIIKLNKKKIIKKKDETKEKPNDKNKEKSKNEIEENPKEKHDGEIKEKSKDETKEKTKEKSKKKPKDEIKEKPKDETKEKPKDETKEKPKDETKEKTKKTKDYKFKLCKSNKKSFFFILCAFPSSIIIY
jgi:RecQ family ATP-dependent DNA helicase